MKRKILVVSGVVTILIVGLLSVAILADVFHLSSAPVQAEGVPVTSSAAGQVEGAPVISSVPAQDHQPAISSMPVHLFGVVGDPNSAGPGMKLPPTGTIVPGSTSTLWRTEEGLTMSIHTHGLPPGVYTNWWIIDEQQDNPFVDPNNERGFEIGLRATGGVVSPDGIGNFQAHLPVGAIKETDWVTVLRNGDGMFDSPMTAKVMVVIRWHGPLVSDMLTDQMDTFGGACSNVPQDPSGIQVTDFVCFDPQKSMVHEP